jgi:hypothetical protein
LGDLATSNIVIYFSADDNNSGLISSVSSRFSRRKSFFLYLKIKMDKPNELDFSSSEFNALEALLSPDVTVPVPEAPMYDNLGQFVSTLNRARAKQAQGDVRFHLVV